MNTGKVVVARFANRMGRHEILVYADGSYRGENFGGWSACALSAIDEIERKILLGYHGKSMKRRPVNPPE